MRFSIRTVSGFILCLCSLLAVSQIQPESAPTQEPPTLADIARQYQQRKQARDSITSTAGPLQSAISLKKVDPEAQYEGHIRQLFAQTDFGELEKEAEEARSSKTRFPGGVWKLYIFYQAINPPPENNQVTEADWNDVSTTIKKWIVIKPQSITARIALAHAYMGLAWRVRGGGYANTVTDNAWTQFGTLVQQARHILTQAKSLKERCPYWYEVMQHVALAEGWEKERARALLDEAVSLEPLFYHYYREYANFLAPKWYGDEGEAERFGEEAADRIGGAEGAFVYFEVASVIHCPCTATGVDELHMSWPRIQEGYKALTQLYGTSRLKENRFAYMAYLAKDKAVARNVFTRIGANWEPTLWRKRQSFETVRLWAMSQ